MMKSPREEGRIVRMLLNNLPVLIIAFPLVAGILCPLITLINSFWGRRAVIIALGCSLALSIVQIFKVVEMGEPWHYWIGGWMPPYGIEFVIDGVNALIVALVACIGFMTSLFSSPFETGSKEKNLRFKSAGYYSILCFLAIGLLGMSSTGDAFNLYVFMEIVALAGYGLIAIGEEKGIVASFRYLLTGTIGACMYLMGIGFLYSATGTLNMADIAAKLPSVVETNPTVVIIATACLIVGFGIKMALFPLHGWQPAAHSYAHPAADPMIAGAMIKIPAYAMLRFFFCILGETTPYMSVIFKIVGVLAVCGILFGSLRALRYNKINKVLAYSSIGQVGYVALGFAIGNYYGLIGAVLHIINHAFMKTGLFYTSGALKYKYGIHYMDKLGQVYKKMPVTSMTMVVLMLSMIGLPPFAGFFSKWYLALGAIQNGQYLYVAVLIISSLLSAIYFFRIFEHLFMDKEAEVKNHTQYDAEGKGLIVDEDDPFCFDKEWGDNSKHKLEIPLRMLIPIVFFGLMIILLGLGNNLIVSGVLKTTVLEVFLG